MPLVKSGCGTGLRALAANHPVKGIKRKEEDKCENSCASASSREMPVKKELVSLGTTIHQEQPFVYILSSKFRTECCDYCFKKCSQLSKCSNCKYVYYCGRSCQRLGWTIHKQECKNLKHITPRILPDAARMLYRLLKKLEGGGITFKAYYTKKDFRMWRDLMSHYAELKTDKQRMEHISSLYGVLTEFSQVEELPNSVEFMSLYGRMAVNSFSICNQEMQSLGTGMYLGASIIDHSCQPNALATFEGTTLIIRTVETMPALDWSKIRISYIDVMPSTEERQRQLLETYYFRCDCPKCSTPENHLEMFGAACPNKSCDNSVDICDRKFTCKKCGTTPSTDFVAEFKNVVEFTEMHLNSMKNTIYLDVCKVCLKKHGILYKHHLRHIQVLDLAFEGCIDLEDFDNALDYGLELIQSYEKFYPVIHPLTGLLHLKLCKLLLYKDRAKEAVTHLRKASDVLKVTHGNTSSLYKSEVLPLIQQCRSMLNIIGIKNMCNSNWGNQKLSKHALKSFLKRSVLN